MKGFLIIIFVSSMLDLQSQVSEDCQLIKALFNDGNLSQHFRNTLNKFVKSDTLDFYVNNANVLGCRDCKLDNKKVAFVKKERIELIVQPEYKDSSQVFWIEYTITKRRAKIHTFHPYSGLFYNSKFKIKRKGWVLIESSGGSI